MWEFRMAVMGLATLHAFFLLLLLLVLVVVVNPQVAKPTRAASLDVIQRVRHVIFIYPPIL
jgi:hypothetical protein